MAGVITLATTVPVTVLELDFGVARRKIHERTSIIERVAVTASLLNLLKLFG